jgi:diguanylate cyclase (GGDEF)-like protein
MSKALDWIAPRSWGDGVLKGALFLLLVNGVNWVLTVIVRGLPYGLHSHFVDATTVALPFVALCMASLARQQRLQNELALLASTDTLTGLLNRRAFLSRARAATERGTTGALLLLDADHFKRINDRWGHAAGDACLCAIAERLRASVRPGDLIGRLGGEEFAVFLPGITPEDAVRAGERLCQAVAVEAEAIEERFAVTLSVGAALGGLPLERLIMRADAALYRAKAQGRARLVIWTEALETTGAC